MRLIDADALGIGPCKPELFDKPGYGDGWNSAIRIIQSAETIDPVKHGKWEYDPNGMDWNIGAFVCSECHVRNANLPGDKRYNPYKFSGSKYCPNCGARMDEQA